MTRDIALLVNPTSGRGKAGRLAGPVRDRLIEAGAAVQVIETRSAAHATEAAAQAASLHPIVAAMGGDGTVAYVANGVVGSKATLGIVPTGSGNDFAAALGYPRRKPLDACAILLHGEAQPVDVGWIEGQRAFLCVAGAGFDSEVNRVANEIRWARGTAVYVVAVLKTLRRFRPVEFRLRLDDQEIVTTAMFVAIGNARSYGGGMLIAPGAVPDDGVFDVVIVGAMSRAALLGQFPRLFKGTHVRHPAVTVRRAARVHIDAAVPFALYADGEQVAPLPASLSIRPREILALRAPPERSHGRAIDRRGSPMDT